MQAYQLKDRVKPKHSPQLTRHRGRTLQAVSKDASVDSNKISPVTKPPTVSPILPTTPANSALSKSIPKMDSALEALIKSVSNEVKNVSISPTTEIKSVNTTIGTLNKNVDSLKDELKSHQVAMDNKYDELENQNTKS